MPLPGLLSVGCPRDYRPRIPGTVSVTQGHDECPLPARLRTPASEAPMSAPGRDQPSLGKTLADHREGWAPGDSRVRWSDGHWPGSITDLASAVDAVWHLRKLAGGEVGES
jgi:hypothetical protein